MVENLGSVSNWLRMLRYSTECYELVVVENSDPDDDMDDFGRNSGEYVNIWECESDGKPKNNGESDFKSDNVGANVSGAKDVELNLTLPEPQTTPEQEIPKINTASSTTKPVEVTKEPFQYQNSLLDRFRTTENSEYLDSYLRYLEDLDTNVPPVLNSSESVDSWYSFQVSESSSENSINLSDVNSDLDESVSSYVYYNGKDNSSDYFTDVVSLSSNFDEVSDCCNCKSQESQNSNKNYEQEHVYVNVTALRSKERNVAITDSDTNKLPKPKNVHDNERIYENVNAIFPKQHYVNVAKRLNVTESFRSNPETSRSQNTRHFGNSTFYFDVNVDHNFHKSADDVNVNVSETLGLSKVRKQLSFPRNRDSKDSELYSNVVVQSDRYRTYVRKPKTLDKRSVIKALPSQPDTLINQRNSNFENSKVYSNVDLSSKHYSSFEDKNVRKPRTLHKRSVSDTLVTEPDFGNSTRLSYEASHGVVDDLFYEENFLRNRHNIGNTDETNQIYEVGSRKDEISSDLDIQGDKKSTVVLNLNFGKICRVSVNFNEHLEDFEVVQPIKVEQLLPEIGLDVMVWKQGLRYSYWEEEENIMENNELDNEELLKSFNQLPKEKFSKSDNRFPLDENDEDEVQIRDNYSSNRFLRANHSRTTDGSLGRRIYHNRYKKFDIRGLTKIQLPNERSPLKLSHEYVTYDNDELYRVNEVNNAKALLRRNVNLKSARLTNNKNVELKDCNNLSYTLYFDSSKDAKTFIESENVQSYVNQDSKTTITKTLLKLLGKRSSREILEKKGIYKNEPIFGNTLRDIYMKGGNEVPPFIYKVIELIERPENITSLGLYRTSGNLATIQKIRFEVDNGRLDILDEFSKDVDVLTGSLKLFFRELKEPLITCEVCDEILGSIKPEQKLFTAKDKDKLRTILSKNLHEANLETLFVLLRHLLEVIKFKEDNKMDPYNLAVCWGPSSIFSVNQELSRDIVTQSQDATRLIEFLLNFYRDNQEELYHFGTKKLDRCPLIRNGSKDSVGSHDSNNKNSSKKSASTSSLSVDEIIKKTVEIIELNITSEGLYKKSGSVEKTNKIMKKLTKKKIHELDKHKNDVYDVTDALKKYLRESQDAFVTKETVDKVLAIAEPFQKTTMDLKSAQSIESLIETSPKKDTFVYLLRHILKTIENQHFHKVSKTDLISIWTNVLNYQRKCHPNNESFSTFLTVVLEVFDENSKFVKSDAAAQKSDAAAAQKSNVALNNVLKDLRSQQERDRYSRYDNVSDNESRGEANILDPKTENTKL